MQRRAASHARFPLYDAEQRRRRDASPWTVVQGVLAPLQFVVFFVSLCLVLRFLITGHGESAATASIVVKTLLLYAIMITGCIWERDVFGRYLFAPAFFWEDVVQHAGAGAAHRLPRRAVLRRAGHARSRCCWRWPPMPPT